MSLGMNASTGQQLDGLAHIRQSIRDILTTPLGSRIMRRDYGSLLPELIDQPLVGATLLRALAATAMALIKWEPRIYIKQLHFYTTANNQLAIHLEGECLDNSGLATADSAIAFKPASLDITLKGGKV